MEEIIQHLVQSILHRFFKDKTAGFLEDSAIGKPSSHPAVNAEHCDSIETSRDYLAKLLFWYFIGYLTCYAVSFLACVVIYHHHYRSFIPILSAGSRICTSVLEAFELMPLEPCLAGFSKNAPPHALRLTLSILVAIGSPCFTPPCFTTFKIL